MEHSGDIASFELSTTQDKTRADGHDYRLITKASDEFERCNYDSCIDILEQLEALNGNDIKLRFNKAVAKFYKGNCKDYMTLLKHLEEIDFSEYNSTAEKYMTVNPLPLAIYNKAVIYYHRHMYKAALDVLEPLTNDMDKCDDCILALVAILELRLLLASSKPKKALHFLEVLMQKVGINKSHLTTEDCNPHDSMPILEENLNKSLKHLSMLTQIINKKAIVVSEDGSAEFSALKAHQYYLMKDFQMAAKQLKKINISGYKDGLYQQELNTLIANNMGVIHLRVRHYAIAANFFQNAISFDKPIAVNLRNAQLQYMSSVKSCEILYNLGISLLHLRRPTEAFQCFLVPLKTYHNNPRLWLRIAEACIMEHEIKRQHSEKHYVATGNRTFFSNRVSYLDDSQSSAVLEPTMAFAALSLRNALCLIQHYLNELESEEFMLNEYENNNWKTTKDNNFCMPSSPVTKETFGILLSSIYAAYSYVSLRLGDYVTALQMAENLLKSDALSDAHKMLAHMYAGEALIMMDKLSEGRSHLEPTFVSNLNTFDFETKDWQVKSLDAAQNVVRYNFAVAVFLQGDIEMARSLLNTCTHPIVSQKVSVFKNIQAFMLSSPVVPAAFFGSRI